MSRLTDALAAMAAEKYTNSWKPAAWKQYVLTGDRKHLKPIELVAFGRHTTLPASLLSALDRPSRLDTEGRRFLEALITAGHWHALGQWLGEALDDAPARDEFDLGCQLLRDLGCPPERLAFVTADVVRPLAKADGTPSSAGRLLSSVPESTLREWLAVPQKWRSEIDDVGAFLAGQAPARLAAALGAFLETEAAAELGASFWCGVLERNPPAFADLAQRGLQALKDRGSQFQVLGRLADFDATTHRAAAENLGVELLLQRSSGGFALWCDARDAGIWLASHPTEAALTALKTFFSAPLSAEKWEREHQGAHKNEVLEVVAKSLGPRAVPLYEACFEADQVEVQLCALRLWAALTPQPEPDRLLACVRRSLQASESAGLARLVRLLGVPQVTVLQADLWPLLAHKSRPVRDAAATAMARLGEAGFDQAAELWKAKRADTRTAAVAWLAGVGTPAALKELEARLELEPDDTVRDALLLALEKLTGGAGGVDPAALNRRIRQTVAKLEGPPAPWLDPKTLPVSRLKNGERLSPDAVRYLLYRQSRVKEMRADVEARPLFQALDRSTSGELGLAVLRAFLGSTMEAGDRWAMAFAALVGDDRLVPLLTRQIREWADASRGKLSEYAVHALALLGSQAALLAVDAMAIRYRSKYKNIGKAAAEAFADAARSRGLTPEELGDEVVPWLGFEPGKPRIVETGKTSLEVRIGPDLKLTFRDTATNKRLAKLPDSAPAAVKAEFKDVAASLREAAKSQLLRLENLMVRQFRWPVARWRELFRMHPLLQPFAQRLVWGHYAASGPLDATFRALEDGSLTNPSDEPFDLPGHGAVGIVHPLELGPERCQEWIRHLADYDVTPPFPQLERPVIRVKPDERDRTFSDIVTDTELNAMTFKGRAERLGWSRGSVCDAGGINFYLKTFPTAGVDVFVGTPGMFVGMGVEDEIKLGDVFFVKSGSVRVGSYEYDEPADRQDPRLVAFGDVPPIAFSEAMGDLTRIAAKSAASNDE